jgi:hypothetical protein
MCTRRSGSPCRSPKASSCARWWWNDLPPRPGIAKRRLLVHAPVPL